MRIAQLEPVILIINQVGELFIKQAWLDQIRQSNLSGIKEIALLHLR